MAIIFYVASLLKKSSKVSKKKQFAFKRFNKKIYFKHFVDENTSCQNKRDNKNR